MQVVLRTPPGNTLEFLAGQYINIIGPNGVRRSYSIANAPRADGKIELHIKKLEGGELSAYWFNTAQVNDLLRFEGPLGTFFMRQPWPRKLILMATGTGLAPIKGLLEQLQTASGDKAKPEVHVYWGNRAETDIYTELAELRFALDTGLHFHPILSRAGNAWKGRTGYIQDAVVQDHPNLADCAVYACGSNTMIQSAKQLLIESGLPSNQFYSDAFVSSKQ